VPVERRRSFHFFNGNLCPSKFKIVVSAGIFTSRTLIWCFKTLKKITGAAPQNELHVIFATAKLSFLGKLYVEDLSACGNRSIFFICRPERSLSVADLAVDRLHEHAKFFREIETTSNFARVTQVWMSVAENFHSVTSGACLKLQENFRSVPSGASLKL